LVGSLCFNHTLCYQLMFRRLQRHIGKFPKVLV
jgi:hypothetical protein